MIRVCECVVDQALSLSLIPCEFTWSVKNGVGADDFLLRSMEAQYIVILLAICLLFLHLTCRR